MQKKTVGQLDFLIFDILTKMFFSKSVRDQSKLFSKLPKARKKNSTTLSTLIQRGSWVPLRLYCFSLVCTKRVRFFVTTCVELREIWTFLQGLSHKLHQPKAYWEPFPLCSDHFSFKGRIRGAPEGRGCQDPLWFVVTLSPVCPVRVCDSFGNARKFIIATIDFASATKSQICFLLC